MPSEDPEIRIALDENDFKGLVSGQIVSVEGIDFRGVKIDVKMILKDIGWDRMVMAIRDAIEGHAVDGSGTDTAKTDAVGTAEGRSVPPEVEEEGRETQDAS